MKPSLKLTHRSKGIIVNYNLPYVAELAYENGVTKTFAVSNDENGEAITTPYSSSWLTAENGEVLFSGDNQLLEVGV